MSMKWVKKIRRCEHPGTCAICGNPYTGKDRDKKYVTMQTVGWVVLLQDNQGITEPYRICNDCMDTAEKQGVIED